MRVRTFHALVHWVLLGLVVIIGSVAGWLVLAGKGPDDCAYATAYLPNVSLFLVGVASFFLGHLLQISDRTPIPRSTANWSAAAPWRRKAMQTVFLALAVIWALEAVGTARISVSATGATVEPITFYTRCAIYTDFASFYGVLSHLTVGAVLFLAGHWLWPERREG